ncbi:MAG TPA: AAA family ATPase, partial [Candidatus Cloacimonadota bacterium]|nr:AAA family ATPase [Candidatus Cloacimonadota bacterium]
MLMDVFFPMNRKEYLERTFDNYYKTNQMRRIPQLRIPNEHDQNIHRINTCERSMLWSVRREGESGGRILFFKENNKIIIWDMDEHDEVYQHAKRNISRFNQQSDVINGPLVNVTHKFMTKDEKEIANQSAIHIENLSEEVLKRAFGLEHYQIANIKKSGKITLNEIISLDPQSYFKISYYLQQNRSTQLKAISDEHFYKFIKSKDVSRLLIYLDSRQNQILNELGNQSVFLNGVSGSGKTTILIYKAVDYAEKNPDKKCILFTYNVLLAKDIITCLSELCPNSIDNLEVYPYYNWMKDIFSDYYQDYKMSNHLLLSENPELKLSKTEDSYLDDLLRSNGNNDEVSLSELTKVIQYAQKTKKYSYDLLPVILGLQTELKSQHRFDAIFVDEVQDIYSNGLNFLRKIRRDENSIMIMVGDYIQSIYTKYSSWKDKGLPEIREHHKV